MSRMSDVFVFGKDKEAVQMLPGVTRKSLAYSETMIVCEIRLEKGAVIRPDQKIKRICRDTVKPDHSHLTPVRFIKSKLPMKAAFRIGCGALKYKKIRLFFTIFFCVLPLCYLRLVNYCAVTSSPTF